MATSASTPSAQRGRRQTSESGCGVDARRSARRPSAQPASSWASATCAADVRAQPLGAVPAEHEPELERPEPAAQRDLPVAVVDDGAGVGRGVAQVLRQDRQGAGEGGPVGDPEERRVEAGEQPLVRVGGVAVGPLDAGLQRPQFGDDGADAGVGGVDVQPDAVLLADRAELGERVDRGRRRRPDRGADQHRACSPRATSRSSRAASAAGRMARSPSTSTMRTASVPSPAMRTAFSIEECVSADDVDGGPLGLHAVAHASRRRWPRCRAASRATRLAPELESWTTPPPVPVERKDAGRPSSSANQSMTCCSSSVAAGLVTQDMPWTPRPAETRSPSTDGPGGVGGEVAEEPGVLPVRDAREHDAVEVGQDGGEGLALLRGAAAAARRARRPARPSTAPGRSRSASSSRRSSPRPRGRAAGTARESCAVQARSPGTPYAGDRAGPGAVREAARGRKTKTLERSRPARRRGAGPEGPRRAPGRAQRSRGTARGRGAIRRIADQHSAPGATRTHTARVLNPLPLPIGVRGRAGGAGSREQPSGECRLRRRR